MSDQHPSYSICADPECVQFLRLRAVSRMTGLARSTILRMIAKNDFPAPVRLTTRVIARRRSDLDRWSEQRPTVTHPLKTHDCHGKVRCPRNRASAWPA